MKYSNEIKNACEYLLGERSLDWTTTLHDEHIDQDTIDSGQVDENMLTYALVQGVTDLVRVCEELEPWEIDTAEVADEIDRLEFDVALMFSNSLTGADQAKLVASANEYQASKVHLGNRYVRPEDIGKTLLDELCESQGTTFEDAVNEPKTPFEKAVCKAATGESDLSQANMVTVLTHLPAKEFIKLSCAMSTRYMAGKCVDNESTITVPAGKEQPIVLIYDPIMAYDTCEIPLSRDFTVPINKIAIAMPGEYDEFRLPHSEIEHRFISPTAIMEGKFDRQLVFGTQHSKASGKHSIDDKLVQAKATVEELNRNSLLKSANTIDERGKG